jgi:hypothetical protein
VVIFKLELLYPWYPCSGSLVALRTIPDVVWQAIPNSCTDCAALILNHQKTLQAENSILYDATRVKKMGNMQNFVKKPLTTDAGGDSISGQKLWDRENRLA